MIPENIAKLIELAKKYDGLKAKNVEDLRKKSFELRKRENTPYIYIAFKTPLPTKEQKEWAFIKEESENWFDLANSETGATSMYLSENDGKVKIEVKTRRLNQPDVIHYSNSIVKEESIIHISKYVENWVKSYKGHKFSHVIPSVECFNDEKIYTITLVEILEDFNKDLLKQRDNMFDALQAIYFCLSDEPTDVEKALRIAHNTINNNKTIKHISKNEKQN